jgi:phasin family protein
VRENLNAITKSNADLLAGFEAITKQIFSFAQSQLESSLSLQKSLVGSKNLRDAFETQLEYAKSSYEQGINELTKISENVLKVANQSAEPIQSRINNTIEKAFKSSI